jgi:SpoVK/Ycf46/Vps4 family AAA+-type ATPase
MMLCLHVTFCNTLVTTTVNHSDYNCVYVGEGAKKLKSQFNQARKHKKAIIFIDEVSLYRILMRKCCMCCSGVHLLVI